MASTQYKMRYGQYESSVAKQLSIDYLGTVVYSGRTREIWVDGKCIAANYQGSVEELQNTIGDITMLSTASKTNLVSAINSLVERIDNLDNSDLKTAEITTESGASKLTIFGKKQTDGLVEDDSTKDFSVNIEGEYGSTNPLVTKVYVDEQINKILGSEDLERTLDTIKEIQDELLKDVKYFVTYTYESEEEDVEVVKVVDEINGTVTYVDENNVVVATETEDGIEYETGYSALSRESAIDSLMQKVDDNKDNIENIETKNLVANVLVDENKDNEFVSATTESETDEFGAKTQEVTIGVKYGTFKTGRGNVMDAESTAFEDGIATVKGVQDYVEERMVWDEFVSDAGTLTNEINNIEGTTYNVSRNSELNESIVIK